jgi:hypothetical protein
MWRQQNFRTVDFGQKFLVGGEAKRLGLLPRYCGFAEGEPETFDSRRADGGVDSIYLGENDSLLKGDVWRGDILGDLIAMKPKPVAWWQLLHAEVSLSKAFANFALSFASIALPTSSAGCVVVVFATGVFGSSLVASSRLALICANS